MADDTIPTSGRRQPKPATFVNVGVGEADYVMISRYRIKRVRDGWHLYIAGDDGTWGTARFCGSRPEADRIVQEHMGNGSTEPPCISTRARCARLEVRMDHIEEFVRARLCDA